MQSHFIPGLHSRGGVRHFLRPRTGGGLRVTAYAQARAYWHARAGRAVLALCATDGRALGVLQVVIQGGVQPFDDSTPFLEPDTAHVRQWTSNPRLPRLAFLCNRG